MKSYLVKMLAIFLVMLGYEITDTHNILSVTNLVVIVIYALSHYVLDRWKEMK